jgi:hypothetical protein
LCTSSHPECLFATTASSNNEPFLPFEPCRLPPTLPGAPLMKSRNDPRCGEVRAPAVVGLPDESTTSKKEPDLFEAKSMAELMEESRVLNDSWPARDLIEPDLGLGRRWGRRGC